MNMALRRPRRGRNSLLAAALMSLWVLTASLVFAAGRGRFTADGYLVIDGKPRLIVGTYELPKDDAKLRELASSGLNLVRVPSEQRALDRVHKHGLYGWIALGSALALREDDDTARERLTQTIEKFKDHPALLSWEAPDEALWKVWYQRVRWVFGAQREHLSQQLEEAKADMPVDKLDAFRVMLMRANDFGDRGLWEQSEQLYETLWKELGHNPPKPHLRMSLAEREAHDLGRRLTRGWQVVRSIDPVHVLWQNHAPRNSIESLRFHNQAVDAAGCDIYPVPFNYGVRHGDLSDTNLSAVGTYTDRMRAGAPGKSVWMVLQGFGWRDLDTEKPEDAMRGRRPRWEETRFMAYNAIVHGANAILYWGTEYIEKDSPLWGDLMRVARELRALEPAIVGQRAPQAPAAVADETYGSVDGTGPQLMLRKAADDWVLIATNEVGCGVAFEVTGLADELNGKSLYRLYSDESHTVEAGRFRDGIAAHGVHVYATSRRFEAK